MKSRIPAIARKETLHILRDWRPLAMAFAMPMLLILLFGYAITFDIKNLKLAVADEDNSAASRALIEKFASSLYFVVTVRAGSAAELPACLEDGRAQVALAIPRDFGKNLGAGRGDRVQVLIDGSESNTAGIGAGYLNNIINSYNMERVTELLARLGLPAAGVPPIDPAIRIWFNPLLESSTTIVPGLIGAIIVVVSALLTCLTVVRERENGSLEGLFATPVRKREILIGKMLPYLAIAMIDTALVAFVGVVIFGVAFNGSVALFFAVALVFTFVGLGIGLMASVLSPNQLLANQLVILITMLPSFLLSGFMFPIKSMPGWVQAVTYAVPARFFIQVSRGIMLKAQTWNDVRGATLVLLAIAVVVSLRAFTAFKKKL